MSFLSDKLNRKDFNLKLQNEDNNLIFKIFWKSYNDGGKSGGFSNVS